MRQHYGYCPHCGADVIHRTRGGEAAKDTCSAGHVYLGAYTLPSDLLRDWVRMVRGTLALLADELGEPCLGFPRPTPDELNQLAQRCKRTLAAIPVTTQGEPD